MAESDIVSDIILEDKLVDLWQDFPCLYEVRSPHFKNRDKREAVFTQIAEKLQQTGMFISQSPGK
jgi:hypothetical protein